MWGSGKLTGLLVATGGERQAVATRERRRYRCRHDNKITSLRRRRFLVLPLNLREQCSEVLRAGRREQFVQFLETKDPLRYLYFVSTLEGAVVACHGLELDATNQRASFAWGMVDRAFHGRGVGTCMTRERIKIAKETPTLPRSCFQQVSGRMDFMRATALWSRKSYRMASGRGSIVMI